MALSRRKFIKSGLVAAGTAAAALGGLGFARNLFAKELPNEEKNKSGNAQVLRYLDLERSGELERREQALWALFERCRLCPRLCGANRAKGKAGICSVAENFKVASYGPHFGEEKPLRGRSGSGTIFFSNCNLLCVFCLNWQINHRGDGEQTSHAELADMMLELQRKGCHNINLVTPTHLVPHIVKALRLAIAKGLHIPLLYNSSGYESLEVLKLLDGIVDVYLPDFKYQNSELAARFSEGASDYVRHTAAAIKEMHRQVGVLKQTDGIAHRGLLIRHLVLPENLAGTDAFVRWVVSELGSETHVNIMGQYSPLFRAREYPPLDRRVTQQEFEQALRWAREAGLRNFH
ncbi:MAG: hypothetical protein LBU89_14375 [Fibromonadaceae bacterium]|jgi:putative pyruvate formate lyase activating enzyme|nr:hypothetical protein [Fibromonadaceae bacterium]